MKRLLFIGPAPQNIGGISIHIRRLSSLINKDFMIDYVDEGHIKYDGVFNLRSGNLFKYFEKVIKTDIVHIQSGTWSLRAFHIFICKLIFRKKVLVTIHRDPNIEPHTRLTKRLLKKCDYAILVNKEGYDSMSCESRCKYVLLPAFLPPNMDEEPALPGEIEKWINTVRKTHDSFIMCSNAWNLVLHNGEDLYGLDMCVEAMSHLDKHYYLLFIVASNTDQIERMAEYKRIIKDNHLENNILIWESPASFVRVLSECDLVLRVTNTDGDAVSIREAMYYGKPVLASDIVKRPEGVILFKTRDTADMLNKICFIETQKEQNCSLDQVNYRQLYLSMYDN